MEWERNTLQDIILNIELTFDESFAVRSDDLADTVDYKTLKRKIMEFTEKSQYYLIEKLASQILDLIMEDPKVTSARIRLDKPHALRFARSVSVEMEKTRSSS